MNDYNPRGFYRGQIHFPKTPSEQQDKDGPILIDLDSNTWNNTLIVLPDG